MLEDFVKNVRNNVNSFVVGGITFRMVKYYRAEPLGSLSFIVLPPRFRNQSELISNYKRYYTDETMVAIATDGIIVITDERFFGNDIGYVKRQAKTISDTEIIFLSDVYSEYLPGWNSRFAERISQLDPIPIPKGTAAYRYCYTEYTEPYLAALTGKNESHVINFLKPNGYEIAEAIFVGRDLDDLFDEKKEKNKLYLQYAIWQSNQITGFLQTSRYLLPYELRLYQALTQGTPFFDDYEKLVETLQSRAPNKINLPTKTVQATFETPLGNLFTIRIYTAVLINWFLEASSSCWYIFGSNRPKQLVDYCTPNIGVFSQILKECTFVTTDHIVEIKRRGKVIYSHERGSTDK